MKTITHFFPLSHFLWIFLFLFLGKNTGICANAFQVTIGGTGDDYGNQIIQTKDGGYAIAGYTNSFGAGGNDVYIVKLDANGNIQWTRTVGGSGDDYGISITQAKDSGYAITGYTNSFGAGGNDFYIIKLDKKGTVQWTRTLGGNNDEYGYQVIQTLEGGYAIIGSSNSFADGSHFDIYLVKLDANGILLWTRTVGTANVDDVGNSIVQNPDSSYCLSGWSWHSLAGNIDIYLANLDKNGVVQWITDTGGSLWEGGSSVSRCSDGGYIVGGATWSGQGMALNNSTQDLYLVKYGSDGNMLWNTFIGGPNNELTGGCGSVIQNNAGGYTTIGTTDSYGAGNSDFYIVNFDNNGKVKWTTTVGGTAADNGQSIIQNSNGDYVVAGSTASFGAGGNDIFVVKLDTAGNSCGNTSTGGVSSTGFTSGATTSASGNGSISGSPVDVFGSGGNYNKICGCLTFTITVSNTNVSCNGLSNGSATVTAVSGGTSPFSYSWNTVPVQTTVAANNLAAGTYTVTISDTKNCMDTATVKISQPPAVVASVSPDITIEIGTNTQLSAGGGSTYSWSPSGGLNCSDCANPVSDITQTTRYCVVVSAINGCSDTACVSVTVNVDCVIHFIPDTFSPNGDGVNDVFSVQGAYGLSSFDMTIYNRWGEKIFESTDANSGWDGTYKGRLLYPDVFVYYVKGICYAGDQVISKVGNVSLIR